MILKKNRESMSLIFFLVLSILFFSCAAKAAGLPTPNVQAAESMPMPQVKIQPAPEKKDIFLNFENSSLSNVVNYMAELRNINLMPDKATESIKVSLSIREALTSDQAWKHFLTLLEMSGFSIVEVGGLNKVMPKDKKLTEALPCYINVPYTTLPDSDITVRYVVFLQNLQVEAIRDLLETLLSDKHVVYPYKDVNGFIITDRCYNIKSAMKIVQELDQIGQPETVVVMRLKRTNASDVKQLLEALMKKPEGNPLARLLGKQVESTTEYFPTGTRIVAEDRTNSLILMGTAGPIKKIEDFIVNNIDTELKGTQSPLHIYELQYSDAAQIAEILREVTAPPDQGPGQQAAKYGAVRGGVKYFKGMKFQVDKEGNRLIVSSTDNQDWELLKKTIKDLDKPQPQVSIETLFVEVNAKEMNQIGGAIRNKKHNQIGRGIDFQSSSIAAAQLSTPSPTDANSDPVSLLGNMLLQTIKDQGSTILSFGTKSNIWAVFQMLRTFTNASILSQPFITIGNKVAGKISVGSDTRVVTESTDAGTKGYTDVTAETVLDIEPQINLDGIIRMKIGINISDFTNATLGEKTTKQVNTNITMADGQVLVLGGFVKTKVSEDQAQTPFLSQIPVLGWFFKGQRRQVDRTYIFIFMAPTIIKPRSSPGIELYSKMKLHRATEDIESGIKTIKTSDPIFNWFFDPQKENYSHKVVDFANARYQPTTVDLKHDPYYRSAIDDDQASTTPQAPTISTKSTPSHSNAATQPPQAAAPRHEPVVPAQAPESMGTVIEKNDSPPKAVTTVAAADDIALDEKIGSTATHPAREEVLSVLKTRMQQTSVPPEPVQLAEQRQKLKTLISQSFGSPEKAPKQSQATMNQHLTPLPDSPQPAATKPQFGFSIDPAKRNSLKEFLSLAQQSSHETRNGLQ